jgi:uncharacterized protein GlcG (DUF336 family)/mannose-6-phosphate isomerase-like protein (cupin superfamily)
MAIAGLRRQHALPWTGDIMSQSLRVLCCIPVLLSVIASAQQPPLEPRDGITAAEIADRIGQSEAAAKSGTLYMNGPLMNWGPFRANMEYHDSPAASLSVHEADAELFVVVDGSGTMTLGGKLVNPTRNGSNLTSPQVEGATPRKLAKGDMLLVPPYTPHAVTQVDGRIILMSMHLPVPPAAAADADPRHAHDPTRMPGDMAPPSVADTMAMSRPDPGRPFVRPPPDVTPAPPLALSIEAAQAAIDYCKSQGVAVGVAVVDANGVLRAGLSADGATPPGRAYGAVPKALTAVAFRKPSSAAQIDLRADPSLIAKVQPNMMVNAGGVPLFAGDRLLGAIGVSGTGAQQEEACARAGADKIQSRLH